jgi:prepilin-type N-terminal cleavage/methylation domain-containing protein
MVLAKSRWTARGERGPCPAEGGPRRAEAGRESAGEGGFSLIEVLVATTILTVALSALAQLFAIATNANTGAKSTTFAALLAQQKMEQLRGLTWGFDPLGLPLSDTTTNVTVVPETMTGGKGLSPSPAGSLGANTDGYCDFLDKYGKPLGGGTTPPANTMYIRRWSVEPLPTNPNNTLVFQVLVTRSRNRGDADTAASVRRLPDEARIISVKTRKAT